MRAAVRAAAVLAAALICLAPAACDAGPDLDGPPEELSERDVAALMDAREQLDDAIDTEETLRTSPVRARRLARRVRSIVAEGAFESERLDEFGLAALGRLELAVPSLVETDSQGVPEALDRRATKAFLRYAERDPARALLLPAEDAVESIERVVKDTGAGPRTRIPRRKAAPSLPPEVADYLRQAEGDVDRIWPGLAQRLRMLREDL